MLKKMEPSTKNKKPGGPRGDSDIGNIKQGLSIICLKCSRKLKKDEIFYQSLGIYLKNGRGEVK